MDRGAWWGIVHGVTMESDTIERLNKLKQHFALLSEEFFMVMGIPRVYIIDLIFPFRQQTLNYFLLFIEKQVCLHFIQKRNVTVKKT